MRLTWVVMLGALSVPALAVEIETVDAGDHHRIVVQNEFLRMTVVPEWGGRIVSLVDRGIEAELVWSEEQAGGALDDRDEFTSTRYSYRTDRAGDGSRAVVRMSGEARGGFRIDKTLIVRDGSPVIEQVLKISNGSQKARRFWQRNFFRPGGGDLGDTDIYYIAGPDGVIADAKLHGRHDAVSGWTGIVDGETGHGILAVVDLDLLEQFYYWRGSQVSPTLEWIGPEIPAGKLIEGRTWIVLTSDDKAYSDDVVAKYVPRTQWAEREQLEMGNVPGWVDMRIKVQPDERQLARGFTAYRTWGADPGSELRALSFACPRGGSDSMTVQLTAFKPVTVSADVEGPGAEAFSVFYVADEWHKLRPLANLQMSADDVVELRVTFDASAIDRAGKVKTALVIGGEGGQRIELTGTVADFRLPDRRLIMMKAYGGSIYMLSGGPKMEPANLAKLDFYMKDGSAMGQSVDEVTMNPNQALTTVRVRGTELTIGEALEQHPELFADLDNLPALDFSYLNPWIHRPMLHGYRWCETHAPTPTRGSTLGLIQRVAGEKVMPGDERYEKIYLWWMREFGRWLREHGYPDVPCKISDEIAADEVPGWIEVARRVKAVGMGPYTTITGQVAATPSLLNEMNPVADGWQLQLMSTQLFRELTTKTYSTRTDTADITKLRWGGYGNGGARNTWAVRPWESIEGVEQGDVSDWQVLVDGEPLEKIGGPWGNKRLGIAAMSGPTLYIALPDGSNPNDGGHTIQLRYTARRPDPNGEVLVKLDPTDWVSFYGGASKPYRIPYGGARIYGWFAAWGEYPSWGWWAYAHGWQKTERIVFREEDDTAVHTPCWYGVRDGNQDADLYYLARALIRRAGANCRTDAQRAAAAGAQSDLDGLMGIEDELIRLEPRLYSGRTYYWLNGEEFEAQFREGRERLLGIIEGLARAFRETNLSPDLKWGDLPVCARDEEMSDITVTGAAPSPSSRAAATPSRRIEVNSSAAAPVTVISLISSS
ncbi:MAG: hypothetical protein J7M38_13775, partial [Armatimonadetes bacterium]|nr:hypothetical protein [Armatimonadota bacterium]